MTGLTKKDQRRLAKLDALEAGGVDNWEGYDISLEGYLEETRFEEDAENFLDLITEIICSECKIEQPAGEGCGFGITNTEPLFDLILERIEKFKD